MEQELSCDETGQRLQAISGVVPVTASVLPSQPGDGKQHACSRDFAASAGLVPRQYSTAEKIRF
ncbi:transposase [Erwinia tracheiphila PSU-1]|nr:transposase [Erwinia tracheiphila PSU-1]